MNKLQSERILKASLMLKMDVRVEQPQIGNYAVSFFNGSDLKYTNYQAARLFIMSREIETDRIL
jgi:hypothetical protein